MPSSSGPQQPETLPDVDVAIMMESTYPYLKGGVSAVVHDILHGNPDLTFGIVHLTWDSNAPHEDLYGVPANVAWVKPYYLSMQEHRGDFLQLRPAALRMSRRARAALANRLYDALFAILEGDPEPFWQLYDEGMNPRTRSYPLWALLGTKEFMLATRERLSGLGLSLSDTFWLVREFFSLACAVAGNDLPRARVYHAHTTGYASLMGSAGARQHGTSFLLTEHNLYVRDTVNTLLERDMALPVTANDWRTFDVPPVERAWMAWWIEMGRACYPSADAITYLYPKAITEAADLGAPVEKSVVIPNGMRLEQFSAAFAKRQAVLPEILSNPHRTWRLAYIARVVQIKGLYDLIDSIAMLRDRGVGPFHLDVLGPTDHDPAYYERCVAKIKELGVGELITFRGVVNVGELIADYDMLVLPSYNEGQPIVVLEAMTAGIPTVGTEVGGMAQLVSDPLTKVDDDGGNAAVRTSRSWGPCGVLIDPSEQAIGPGMADALQSVLTDRERYAALAANARGRVADFFEFGQTMSAYNRLYRELGGLAESTRRREPSLTKPGRRPLLEADITPSRPTVGQS